MDSETKKELGEQNETTNETLAEDQSNKGIDETANIALPSEADEKPVVEQPVAKTEDVAISGTPDNSTPMDISTKPQGTSNHEQYNEQKPSRRRHYKYIIAGLLIILAFAIGVFGTLLYTNKQTADSKKSASAQPTVTPIADKDSSKTQTTPVKETIKWLDTPQKIAIQPVYTDQWFKETYQNPNNPTQPKIDEILSFYQVGSIGESQLIIATVSDGPGSTTSLFKKTGNSYTLYQQHSNTFNSATEGAVPEYTGPSLTPAVQIDKTSQISDIVAPASLTISNQDFTRSKYGALGVDFITTKEPSSQFAKYIFNKTTAEGTIYEVITKDEASYKVNYYTLMTKDHRMHPYIMSGELFKLDAIQPITWNNGSKNVVQYGSAVGGCGFSWATEIGKNISESSVETTGKSSSGTAVYILKDINDPLLIKHYEEYKEVTKYDNQLPADEKNMTIAQFKQKNGIYIAKDGSDRWVVMTNPDYFPHGGCAKPVVYLYPTISTLANVEVGADVTKSEPFYPAGGWKGVLAQPNGNLQYQGKAFNSLFWEGYGKGVYPEIISGSFVKRADAERKIKSDLARQGLNSNEINDFWAFWSTKVPSKEYVRLTWFGNSQLQTLAPLYVVPKPDTVIRVFLDMEGVDTPYPLPQQSLFAPKRTGFTVVEWGGLARDGSVPKIQ